MEITYNRWMKPTSRHRGKTQNIKPSGRPDLTVVEIIYNHWMKPTSRHRGKTQNTKPSGKPDLTVVEIIYDRWIKPTPRHRGNPSALQYNYGTQSPVQYGTSPYNLQLNVQPPSQCPLQQIIKLGMKLLGTKMISSTNIHNCGRNLKFVYTNEAPNFLASRFEF